MHPWKSLEEKNPKFDCCSQWFHCKRFYIHSLHIYSLHMNDFWHKKEKKPQRFVKWKRQLSSHVSVSGRLEEKLFFHVFGSPKAEAKHPRCYSKQLVFEGCLAKSHCIDKCFLQRCSTRDLKPFNRHSIVIRRLIPGGEWGALSHPAVC